MMAVPRISLIALVAGGAMLACSRSVDLRLELQRPLDPDPFFGVADLQVSAIAEGEQVDLGRWPWDQGPVSVATLAPTFDRLIVVGLDSDDRVVASGISPELDVVRDPPAGPIPIYFSSVGRLALVGEGIGPRREGYAVRVGDRVVFGGGVGIDGCPRKDLIEVGIVDAPAPRGVVRDARIGARGVSLVDGSAAVLGGRTGEACGGFVDADLIAVYAPDRPLPHEEPWVGDYPPGAAVAALPGANVVVGGGTTETVARTEVQLADPSIRPARVDPVGNLDRPRGASAAAPIAGNRAAFVGGRATTATTARLQDVSVFDFSSGRAVAVTTVFDDGRSDLAVAAIASGALIVAGGVGQDGPIDFISGLSLDPDLSGAFRPADPLGAAAAPGPGELLDLMDGSLLFVPSTPDQDLTWIRLLPQALQTVPRPPAEVGALVGATLAPGLAYLEGEDGSVWSFHSGPSGVLARTAPGIREPSEGLPSGLIPQRPGAASFDQGRLVVEGPRGFALDPVPGELVTFLVGSVVDFDLTVTYRREDGAARPSLVFGLASGDYDHYVLQTAPQVVRSPLRRGGSRIVCQPVLLPELGEAGPIEVRIRRSAGGTRVTLDLGADGSEEQLCETPAPRAGGVAFGVVNGTVSFERADIVVR